MGVVLFELLTRSVPFQGETQSEVCVKIITDPPPPIRELRPDVPPGLQDVILKCLEKDRNKRYPNVAEMALGLLPFAPKHAKGYVEKVAGIIQAAGLSATALSMPLTPDGVGGPMATPTIAPFGRTVFGSSRQRVAMAGVGGAVVVAGIVTAMSLRARRAEDTPEFDRRPASAARPPDPQPAVPAAALPSPGPAPTQDIPLPSPSAKPEPAAASTHPSTKASPKLPSSVASARPAAASPPPQGAPTEPGVGPQDPLQSLRIKK
jgi:serine/threonine-protein kinase